MPKNNSHKSSSFPHWQGRSGLDPVDTYRIQGSVDGTFLRRLLTLQLRTRNIFSLVMMLVFGVSTTGLMLITLYAVPWKSIFEVQDLIYTWAFVGFHFIIFLVLFIGITLLINFLINIGIILGFVKSKPKFKNGEERNRTKPKKKLPKRRKDFK